MAFAPPMNSPETPKASRWDGGCGYQAVEWHICSLVSGLLLHCHQAQKRTYVYVIFPRFTEQPRIIFDFRDKLKRLEHGTTYDSSVLLGRSVKTWALVMGSPTTIRFPLKQQ